MGLAPGAVWVGMGIVHLLIAQGTENLPATLSTTYTAASGQSTLYLPTRAPFRAIHPFTHSPSSIHPITSKGKHQSYFAPARSVRTIASARPRSMPSESRSFPVARNPKRDPSSYLSDTALRYKPPLLALGGDRHVCYLPGRPSSRSTDHQHQHRASKSRLASVFALCTVRALPHMRVYMLGVGLAMKSAALHALALSQCPAGASVQVGRIGAHPPIATAQILPGTVLAAQGSGSAAHSQVTPAPRSRMYG